MCIYNTYRTYVYTTGSKALGIYEGNHGVILNPLSTS